MRANSKVFSPSLEETNQPVDSNRCERGQLISSSTLKSGLSEDKEAYIEFSGHAPLLSRQPIDHRHLRVIKFPRALGFPDSQFAIDTEVLQFVLRANPPRDPPEPVNMRDLELDSSLAQHQTTPNITSCCLISTALTLLSRARAMTALTRPSICTIRAVFRSTNSALPSGHWTLLHALVAAIAIQHPSHEFSALDLCYYYKKAAETELVNDVSTVGFVTPANTAAYNCTFAGAITAQAMDSYMEDLGFAPHTSVVVQPSNKKASPPSRVSTIPCAIKDSAVAQMQRVWIPYTANGGQFGPHCKVEIMKCKACGNCGHYANECPDKEPIKCYNYDETGHMSRECPKPKKEREPPTSYTCYETGYEQGVH